MNKALAAVRKAKFLLWSAAILAGIFGGVWLLASAPRILLTASGVDVGGLQVDSTLKAISDARTAILSLVGSVVATSVATAALIQAHYARKAYEHKRHIDWSASFADSAGMLSDSSSAKRLAGVVALRLLASSAPKGAGEAISATLATYVRTQSLETHKDESVRLAVDTVCESPRDGRTSLRGSNLSGFDLAQLDFGGIDIDGASFRKCTLHRNQQPLMLEKVGVDLADVTWVDG